MHNPVFTVITVTYNAENSLLPTLESVWNQTYRHIEYILVDGASPDGTLKKVEPYRDRFAALLSEPDRSLYDAMNKGMQRATGDYIIFLNAGDRFHSPHILSDVARQIQELPLPPDVIYGQTVLIDSTGHYLRMRHYYAPDLLTWKSFRKGMLVCHQAFWIRRSLWDPYNLHYRYSSDFDWCIRMLKKGRSFFPTHRILIDYLDEGMTTRHHKDSLWERFRIMTVHYGWGATILAHFRILSRALWARFRKKKTEYRCHPSETDKAGCGKPAGK